MNRTKTAGLMAIPMSLAFVSTNAAAASDYGDILTGLSPTGAVAAFIAAAAILALVGFGRWLSKKVGKYFG